MKEQKIVLIVEDSPIVTERLMNIINDVEDVKFTLQAFNYNEAVTLYKAVKPSVIILDINLPDKNGIEVLKTIRAMGGTERIIVLTNYANDFYKNECLEYGADYFLDKSKDFEKLIELISNDQAA
jgi:DNA-binding NarL/FixJ family response regulator